MKFLIYVAIFAMFPTSCALHKKTTMALHHNASHPKRTHATNVISANETGTLVSGDWMRRYKKLETIHDTIPEDDTIYMERDKYRIPTKVADHFNKMVRGEP